MSQQTCRTCRHGEQEQISRNGSPPRFRQACDIDVVRTYPQHPCKYWAEANDLIDVQGRGDSGNHA